MLALKQLYKPILSYSFRSICNVTFHLPDGSSKTVKSESGKSILTVAHNNNLPLEGACEGSLACATCHVILGESSYNKVECANDLEEDLLDSVPDQCETSRLACQVIIPDDCDQLEITLPKHTRNFYVDGHVPKPH
ncbi:hypothetical protein WA158_002081 [Blastocystis sp. Blastoise]